MLFGDGEIEFLISFMDRWAIASNGFCGKALVGKLMHSLSVYSCVAIRSIFDGTEMLIWRKTNLVMNLVIDGGQRILLWSEVT